jgi:hypothetical protein
MVSHDFSGLAGTLQRADSCLFAPCPFASRASSGRPLRISSVSLSRSAVSPLVGLHVVGERLSGCLAASIDMAQAAALEERPVSDVSGSGSAGSEPPIMTSPVDLHMRQVQPRPRCFRTASKTGN